MHIKKIKPANAKAVWPPEAAKWRPDRFDKVTVCDGEESFRWPESPRELVVINYDVLPSTPSQIVDEKAALLAERLGAKPNPDGKTKAEREGQRGLLRQINNVADDYSDLVHRDGGLTTSDRHAAYLLLCEWVTLADKLHKNRRALNLNARRVPAGKPSCPMLLVFDDAHYAENNKAQRTERCRYLAGKAPSHLRTYRHARRQRALEVVGAHANDPSDAVHLVCVPRVLLCVRRAVGRHRLPLPPACAWLVPHAAP